MVYIVCEDGKIMHVCCGHDAIERGVEVVALLVFFYPSKRRGSRKMMNKYGLNVSP